MLWGILHGILTIVERIFDKTLKKVPGYFRVAVTFIIVNFLWVLFRATDMLQATKVYKGMFNFGNLGISQIHYVVFDSILSFPNIMDSAYIFAVLAGCFGITFMCKTTIQKSKLFSFTNKTVIYIAILFLIAVVHMSKVSPFIYFNF